MTLARALLALAAMAACLLLVYGYLFSGDSLLALGAGCALVLSLVLVSL